MKGNTDATCQQDTTTVGTCQRDTTMAGMCQQDTTSKTQRGRGVSVGYNKRGCDAGGVVSERHNDMSAGHNEGGKCQQDTMREGKCQQDIMRERTCQRDTTREGRCQWDTTREGMCQRNTMREECYTGVSVRTQGTMVVCQQRHRQRVSKDTDDVSVCQQGHNTSQTCTVMSFDRHVAFVRVYQHAPLYLSTLQLHACMPIDTAV
jgi:hypothetical protein